MWSDQEVEQEQEQEQEQEEEDEDEVEEERGEGENDEEGEDDEEDDGDEDGDGDGDGDGEYVDAKEPEAKPASQPKRAKLWVRSIRKPKRIWKADEWPTSTSSVCWNCAHQIPDGNLPLVLPLQYDRQTHTFHCRGFFCGWPCMVRYQREAHPGQSPVREFMHLMYLNLYGRSPIKDDLASAPSRHRLAIYGGDMTIEEYRGAQGPTLTTSAEDTFASRYEQRVQRETNAILGNLARRKRPLPDREEVVKAVKERIPGPLQITHTTGQASRGSLAVVDSALVASQADGCSRALEMVRSSHKPQGEERMRIKRLKLERKRPFTQKSQATLSTFFNPAS
jgi:hypothetical protein